MPKLHDTIAARLEELLAEPPQSVVRPEGVFEDKAGVTAGRGWCVSAASLVATVVSDPQHPYRVVAPAPSIC
jgi:hypothetical protein